MINKMRKGWLSLAAAAALVLSACGGGGSGVEVSSSVQSDEPQRTQSRAMPGDAVQDVSPMRMRLQSSIAPKATRISLGALNRKQAAVAIEPGVALQVGEARAIGQTASAAATLGQFQWQSTAVGGHVGAINFASEGATGVRLGVLVRQLPGSAMLRVYSQSRPNEVFQISGQEVLQRVEANISAGDVSDEARTWWTPYLGDSDATLEVELPPGVAVSSLDIAVPRLSHIFTDLHALAASENPSLQVGEAAYCQLDANCYADLIDERNAVARMLFVDGGSSYLCTGTLLNDRYSTNTPYFVTANHCIPSQTVASTLQTRWFYRSASCGSYSILASSVWRYNGAALLYANGVNDTAFMRLNDTPPAGAVFAGWTSGLAALGSSVSSLHHSQGDLLKYARGTVANYGNCTIDNNSGYFSCALGSSASSTHYRVTLTQGITEGGASGAGIFNGGYFVGLLTGGNASCAAVAGTNYAYFGRFDQAYAGGINQWLWGAAPQARTAVYRFYNASTGAHFYTGTAAERDFVIATYPAFSYEGVVFYAMATQTANTNPVFRFFNIRSGAHFYTISTAERDYVLSSYPFFQYEGPRWYGRTSAGESSSAVYRFFNTRNGVHFYTISAAERDFVLSNYPVFQYEGPVYYAWTSQ